MNFKSFFSNMQIVWSHIPQLGRLKIQCLGLLMTLGVGQVSQAQEAGDQFFGLYEIHEIYITFDDSDWYDTLQSYKSLDDSQGITNYLMADLMIDGLSIDSVGVRFKGNSSYYNYTSDKKPFKLDFNVFVDGQNFDGLKKLNLNNMYQDPTFMREKLYLDFAQSHGINGPRAGYVRLYVNDVYWGLYLAVDQIDRTFVNRVFGTDSGNLFKGDGPGASCANLSYHGSLNSYYNCYELKTNTTLNDWSDLVDLTSQINNTEDSQFYDSLQSVLNTDSYIRAWASYTLMSNFDSYPYRFSHNYYVYHDPLSGQFEWIVWDASTAFGDDIPWSVSEIEQSSIFFIWPEATNRPLSNRMLQDSTYRQMYVDLICEFLPDLSPDVLYPMVDSLYSVIQTAVYEDTKKMYSDMQFDENVNTTITIGAGVYPGLKPFIMNRYESVTAELVDENCPTVLGLESNDGFELDFELYPNPAKDELFIRNIGLESSDVQISIHDISGRLMSKSDFLFFNGFAHRIDLSEVPPGLYLISLSSGSGAYRSELFSVMK